MSYFYLTNILISKPKISFQHCAKFLINRQLGCRKNNRFTEPSSLSSRMVTSLPISDTVNRYLCNETTKSIDFKRNFSISTVAQSKNFTPNKNMEKKKNYIFTICLVVYSFTALFLYYYLRRKEDDVYVESEET